MGGKVHWRLVAAAVVVATVSLLVWTYRATATHGDTQAMGSNQPSPPAHPPSAHQAQDPQRDRPPSRIVRITPEQRVELVRKIETARSQRRDAPHLPSQSKTTAVANPPSMDMNNPQDVLAQLQGISKEISAATAECTRKYAPNLQAFKTELTLEGDPDVGTLIDASTPLVDGSGASVPPAFDDCVRTEFQNLELPPLKSGDKYTVSYSEGIRE
jgi:hypothetical protein